jgi:hopanoid biosynthesis associated protein HpnK
MADSRCNLSPVGHPTRRLIVNADDFGRSSSINAAIVQAHRDGILTTASLMVNEPGAAEAVALAREHPGLGVGLHLVVACGRAALTRERIPGLAGPRGEFSPHPVTAGLRYYFGRSLRTQLRSELAAQFERFHATGLTLDHVNGHLHFHLHPVVFDLLMEHAAEWGIRRIRFTRDLFWLNARLAGGHWLRRATHALVFQALGARARPALAARGIRHPHRVFGLLQDGRVDESFVLGLLERLPAGDSELYSHPSLDQFRAELDALVSPRVRAAVERSGLHLIRYQDL